MMRNIHRHFISIFQNAWPLSTKQKPKKKAINPKKNPCKSWHTSHTELGLLAMPLQ